jgi:hypothetical protein
MPAAEPVVHRRTGPPVAGRIGVFALMDSAERRLRCSTPGPSYYSGRARVTLPYRRPGLLVAAVLAVLASLLAPVTAFAAVANETTLTVTFVDGVTLLSVDRAAVHVTAHQDGAVIAEVDGETDAAGISVLINLPHETGEGGVVTLDVTAHKETSFTDSATGCVMNDTWDASRLGVPVDDVALAVPPTDTVGAGDAASSGAAVIVAALVGVSAFALFLVPRRRRAEVRVEHRVRR